MTSFRNRFEFDSPRMGAAAVVVVAAAISTVGVAAFSKGITALGGPGAHFFVSIAVANTPT
jgi:hypothetical protein